MINPRIAQSFARQTMMATLGAHLVSAADGSCVIRAPILPGAMQQQGFGHAALTFAIGDSAAGYAALSVMPEGHEVLTVEMKINLMAPATGDALIAEGRVVKAGRRLLIVTAEVFALRGADRQQIALLQGTMIPVASGG